MRAPSVPEVNKADLEGLLHSCFRNGRPAIKPKPAEPIYFDADRWRWLFRYGQHDPVVASELTKGLAAGWSMEKWRNWVDLHIKFWDKTHG